VAATAPSNAIILDQLARLCMHVQRKLPGVEFIAILQSRGRWHLILPVLQVARPKCYLSDYVFQSINRSLLHSEPLKGHRINMEQSCKVSPVLLHSGV
jgi:hypothetical protein